MVSVRQIVLAEGIAMAIISWIIGRPDLAWSSHPCLAPNLGRPLIKIPLQYQYSFAGSDRVVLHPVGYCDGCEPCAGAQRGAPDGSRSIGV